jgi:hypothetical protein
MLVRATFVADLSASEPAVSALHWPCGACMHALVFIARGRRRGRADRARASIALGAVAGALPSPGTGDAARSLPQFSLGGRWESDRRVIVADPHRSRDA